LFNRNRTVGKRISGVFRVHEPCMVPANVVLRWRKLIYTVATKQDAQLLQRDRASGCVIVWPKVEEWNWETIFYGHYRSIINHCDIIRMKIYRIRWKNAK